MELMGKNYDTVIAWTFRLPKLTTSIVTNWKQQKYGGTPNLEPIIILTPHIQCIWLPHKT